VLVIRGGGDLSGARVVTSAEWSLAGDSFGLGRIQFNELTLSALQDVGLLGTPGEDLYVEGSMDGEIGFVGPILKPASWTGMTRINRLEITPRSLTASGQHEKPQRDFILRNAGPLLFQLDGNGIVVESARRFRGHRPGGFRQSLLPPAQPHGTSESRVP
jgi:hypothetical protein